MPFIVCQLVKSQIKQSAKKIKKTKDLLDTTKEDIQMVNNKHMKSYH